MNNAIPILARWLHTVSLALWLGGLVAIGALVAPTAFSIVRLNPAFAGNPGLQAQIAGGIVGGSLSRFTFVCYACGVLLLLSNLLLWAGLTRTSRLATVAILLVSLVLLGTAFYQGFGLFPAMNTAQGQGNTALFDALHTRYEHLSIQLQFPLLLLLGLLTALRDSMQMPWQRQAAEQQEGVKSR